MVKFDLDVQNGTVKIPTMKIVNKHLVPDYYTTYECKELIVHTDDNLDVEKGEYIGSEIHEHITQLLETNEWVRVRVYFATGYFDFVVNGTFKVEDVKRCFRREIRSIETTRIIEGVLSKNHPRR